MTVLLQPPPQVWVCPNCPVRDVTPWSTPNRFHLCRGLAGITAPLVREGTSARVYARLREDYTGGEDVQFDAEGRPVMSVITERDDGQDCAVLAPTAHLRSEAQSLG